MTSPIQVRATAWYTRRRLDAQGENPAPFITAEIVDLCHGVYRMGGRMTMAVLFSPALYSYVASKVGTANIGGFLPMKFPNPTAWDGLTDEVAVPLYVQTPAPAGDLRLTVVTYDELDAMREDDRVVHALTVAQAMRNVGLLPEWLEEP